MARTKVTAQAQKADRPVVYGNLGQDFGSSRSKVAVAMESMEVIQCADGSSHTEPVVLLARVPLRADMDNPERTNSSDQSTQQFEYMAFAAIDSRTKKLITGRQALKSDLVIPLKTMFVWRAGIHDAQVFLKLPGGPELSDALEHGVVGEDLVDEAVERHFTLLYNMTLKTLRTKKREIVLRYLSISYPNYLAHSLSELDPEKKYYNVEKYWAYYRLRMMAVWGCYIEEHGTQIRFINEGQGITIYLCEPYTDTNDTLDRDQLWAHLRGPDRDRAGSLNLVILDNGSSSINIQVQTVYFDDDGHVASSRSVNKPTWVPGAPGGSHLMNEVVKGMIQAQLGANPRSRPGDLAFLLEQYESMKHSLDHRAMEQPLVLHTADDRCTVAISQEALSNAFDDAFSEALRPEGLLDAEMRALLDLREDFAVVFCGGSFMNVALRRRVEEKIARWNIIATDRGLVVRHCFLSNVDTAPTVGVAAGAALSAMRVPSLAQAMQGAAIGIQVLTQVEDQSKLAFNNILQWDEEEYADFFFGQGGGTPAYINYTITAKIRPRLRFRLVCDRHYYKAERSGLCTSIGTSRKAMKDMKPSYITRVRPATGTTLNFRRLPICLPGLALRDKFVYDMDFEVDAFDLPCGLVRFRARLVSRLTTPVTTPGALDGVSSLWIEIRCCLVGKNNSDVDHPLNKRWQMELETDFATKLAVIGERRVIPITCMHCTRDITTKAYICQECINFGCCVQCFEAGRFPEYHLEKLGPNHTLKAVDVYEE